MKDYSYDNIEKASEEAFRMQKDSRFFDEDFRSFKCNCRFEKNRETPSLHQNGKHCQSSSLSSIDDDKMLILALILILSKNCNDKFLMMALLYIIM